MDVIYWNHDILTSINLVISGEYVGNLSSSYQNLERFKEH